LQLFGYFRFYGKSIVNFNSMALGAIKTRNTELKQNTATVSHGK